MPVVTAIVTDAEGNVGSLTASFAITPASGPVLGMNFEPTPQPVYEGRAHAARVFVNLGVTDVHDEPEFVDAYALGVRTFVLSWKDTSTSTIGPLLSSIPADVVHYDVAHHEPEEMTPADWIALQLAHMPIVRAHGGIPTAVFTSFSLNNPKNLTFRLADWKCPAGTHVALGGDYYPDKESAFTPTQKAAHWRSAMATFGVSRFLLPEFGVIGTAANAVQLINETKSVMPGLVEVATYWSNQKPGKPNYRFTTATANTFFG